MTIQQIEEEAMVAVLAEAIVHEVLPLITKAYEEGKKDKKEKIKHTKCEECGNVGFVGIYRGKMICQDCWAKMLSSEWVPTTSGDTITR